MVQKEFKNHANYFKYDLEDYPLPVSRKFIVYLDKMSQQLIFKRVIPCTHNEAALASWDDILSLYRRATRMAYRNDSSLLLSVTGMIGRICRLHFEIRQRIQNYFSKYSPFKTYPVIIDLDDDKLKKLLSKISEGKNQEEITQSSIDIDIFRQISFNIIQSHSATEEVIDTIHCVDVGDITQDDALKTIVIAFERSLQYLHKILLLYPPIDR